ncbi:MAG: hypothetical protein K9G64_03495 [Bacteroidia bacterium]|nr:hypothetical protein [Bacteroidia bacterium]
MLTIKECKEILNNEAEGLTEDDIIEIREWLSTMADVLIESIENSQAENKK